MTRLNRPPVQKRIRFNFLPFSLVFSFYWFKFVPNNKSFVHMELKRTITFEGTEIEVVFDYQPEEKEDGFVRIKEEIEIEDVVHCDESIYNLVEPRIKEIKDKIFQLF